MPASDSEARTRRIDDSGKYARRHNGVGLGLAIAKKFIAAHGGRIEIQSELGQGTTVSLIYPRERVMSSDGQGKVVQN
jgi:signal transduction histidine kinase